MHAKKLRQQEPRGGQSAKRKSKRTRPLTSKRCGNGKVRRRQFSPLRDLLETAGAKQTGDMQWRGRCPVHGDKRPSLAISVGKENQILVHCHAGCKPDTIARACGLSLADLQTGVSAAELQAFVASNGSTGTTKRTYPTAKAAQAALEANFGSVTGHWEYLNADGELIGVVLRWDANGKKDYRPLAKAHGGWIVGAMPSPRPLYLLPELVAADLVFVVEGEKAADAIRSLGLVATTSAHGAESPAQTNWSPLAGKRIVILPDNDDAGKKFAITVERTLTNLSPRPRVVTLSLPGLPPKGDAVQWIEAGGTAKRLRNLADDEFNVGEKKNPSPSFPSIPQDAAFYGLSGRIARYVSTFTEADPLATLVNILTMFGSAAGRGAFFRVGGDRHYPRLFAVLVGATGKSRKGSSLGLPRELFQRADPTWANDHVKSGLSSGEGLIAPLAEMGGLVVPLKKVKRIGKRGKRSKVDVAALAPPTPDVRLLVVEQEFAAVFKVLRREGNTLSTIMRCAWDDAPLAVLTRREPLEAKTSHVSILANITQDELAAKLETDHASNGFANRFLFVLVQRARLLPCPPVPDESELNQLAKEVRKAIKFAHAAGEMRRDEEAERLWASAYLMLENLGEAEGRLVPALLARASAQVLRLSMIYALLDCSTTIRGPHLRAALALYRYVESSVRTIFGATDGGSVVVRIRESLKEGPKTRTQISKALGGHYSSAEIQTALDYLRVASEADFATRRTDGRAREIWSLTSVNAEKAEIEK